MRATLHSLTEAQAREAMPFFSTDMLSRLFGGRNASGAGPATEAAAATDELGSGDEEVAQQVLSLIALSSSMVARFYALTYVTPDDRESGLAWQLAERAVQLCRGSAGSSDGLLAETLHHYGVAAASCAQVKGLGLMGQAAAAQLPPASEIFASGDSALVEAIELRQGVELALSTAARAELYYCAASANSQGAGAFDGATVDKLIKQSIELNREAVAKLETAAADGYELELATVLKDLGKVLGYAHRVG